MIVLSVNYYHQLLISIKNKFMLMKKVPAQKTLLTQIFLCQLGKNFFVEFSFRINNEHIYIYNYTRQKYI